MKKSRRRKKEKEKKSGILANLKKKTCKTKREMNSLQISGL